MENKITCNNCGVIIEGDDLVHDTVDGDVCETCFDDEYGRCEYTDLVVRADDLHEAFRIGRHWRVETLYVCEQALNDDFERTVDGEWWHRDNTYTLHNHDIISQRDYENGEYSTCDSCGDIYHSDDISYDDDTEEYICYNCERHHSQNHVIHPWNYKPEPIFHGDCRKNTLGIELEIDSKEYKSGSTLNESARYILKEFGTLIYNKEDGSLRNGFELVSHPTTYEYLYQQKETFAKVFKTLSNQGFTSHDNDTCGLHIHVGRAGFKSERAMDNFVYLFEKFYNQVLKFSRRTPYTMQRWADRYGIYDASDRNTDFATKLHNVSHDKYRIVNLRHGATLEVRAFNGTLNVDTYFASVQFMLVMKHLANSANNVVNHLTWQSIVKLARVKGYVELQEYLVKRDLHDVKSPVYKEATEGKELNLTPDMSLTVTSNSDDLYHYIPIFTTVRYVRQSYDNRRDRFVVTPVDPSDVDVLVERCGGNNTQVILTSNLALRHDDGRLIPLTEFTRITFN